MYPLVQFIDDPHDVVVVDSALAVLEYDVAVDQVVVFLGVHVVDLFYCEFFAVGVRILVREIVECFSELLVQGCHVIR